MIRPPPSLEPAPGRILVTRIYIAYEIATVSPFMIRHVYSSTEDPEPFMSWFRPDKGDWIARDIATLEAWARIAGVKLT